MHDPVLQIDVAQLLLELLPYLPVITVILKFLAALCGLTTAVLMLNVRIRRWVRIRRRRKASKRDPAV